jgi:DNA-binding transcriptional MerR regulator
MPGWKVGELARRTGVTVRTLHHYDRIGLLRPSRRAGNGYRLYGTGDVARLHQIFSLRRLGLSLEEIRECLTRPDFSLLVALERHLARLDDQIRAHQALRKRLRGLAEQLRSGQPVSLEDFTTSMEMMTMIEKHYTPEQLNQLAARGEAIGAARIREVEAEWPALIAEVRAAMAAGLPPGDPAVQALAQRWRDLVQEFTGGDPGIAASLGRMYREEPAARERAGIDPAIFAYIGQATGAGS